MALRIGIIGCGDYSRHHIGLVRDLPGAEVVALCSPRHQAIADTVAEYPHLGGLPVYQDHGALLDDPTVDAVIVCSPHCFHAPQVLDAIAAGKHVLVEKPLALSVSDARSAIAARDRAGVVGAVAYQRHGTGRFQFAREAVLSCRYGRVLGVNAHLARPWHQLCAGTWRHRLDVSGGGQINDGGSHLIDAVLWVTGLQARRVSAFMDHRGTEVDIDSVVNVEFEGGALGTLTVIGDSCAWHERHHVWLEHAAVVIETDRVTLHDPSGQVTQVDGFPPPVTPVANFVDAVLRGSEVLAPFECGLHTIGLTEAAWRSAKAGGAAVDVTRMVR
ncbi:MAG: Gfo/Idh/MocA family oxidoreductase [Armatimonadetes bacterium]|nr:Gfo/Idh/MocA family oxidoreductase [Armatimonadota bacterium]